MNALFFFFFCKLYALFFLPLGGLPSLLQSVLTCIIFSEFLSNLVKEAGDKSDHHFAGEETEAPRGLRAENWQWHSAPEIRI